MGTLIVKILIAGTVLTMAAKLLGNKTRDVVTLLFLAMLIGAIVAPDQSQKMIRDTNNALDYATEKVLYVLDFKR
ncbi:hypothetical protein GC174_08680 [bacterium]|nr:hypothetical protein [bacterium]